MKSEDYRSYLVECVKTAGQTIVEMADDIVGKKARITNLNISVDFGQGCGPTIPEITITRSNVPNKEALERLFDIRVEKLKKENKDG